MDTQLLNLFIERYTFENYIKIRNETVVAILQDVNAQFIHLTAIRYLGKTHLLNAWINNAHKQHKSAIYININNPTHQNLQQLTDKFSYIAIDNIDNADFNTQEQLFNLFNRIKLNNLHNKLLTSSTVTLDKLYNYRHDLITRLLSGINLNIKALTDDELLEAINLYLLSEGIKIELHVQKYLINHLPRNIGRILQLINQASHKALLEKRTITTQLIKELI